MFSHDPTTGNLTTTTDPLGHQTILAYTSVSQVETVRRPPAGPTTFTYDYADLIAVTDPLGQVTRRFNDSAGRPVVVTDPRGKRSTSSTCSPIRWGSGGRSCKRT